LLSPLEKRQSMYIILLSPLEKLQSKYIILSHEQN
jgi:hypothetical protein